MGLLRGLAPRKGAPRSRVRRIGDAAAWWFMGAVFLFVFVDILFGLREAGNRASAYGRPTGQTDDDARIRNAIRFRIAVLLKPRDGSAAIGGDPAARTLEAGLLYGRLALLDERRGDARSAASHMADAISRLRSAGHRTATDEYVRSVIAQQDARARRGE